MNSSNKKQKTRKNVKSTFIIILHPIIGIYGLIKKEQEKLYEKHIYNFVLSNKGE